MKNAFAVLILLGVVSLSLASDVSAQPIAERTLNELGYIPGGPSYVTITVTNKNEDVTVIETPPAGWDIVELTGDYSGTILNGVITWNLPQTGDQKKLGYIIIPQATATGDVVFEGKIDDINIGGDKISPQEILEPVGIFQHHNEFSGHSIIGDAFYDNETGEYQIKSGYLEGPGGGHSCSSLFSGSFSLEAKIRTQGSGIPLGMLTAWMPHAEPTDDFPVYYVWRNPSNNLGFGWSTRYGENNNGNWFDDTGFTSGQKVKITRQGDEFSSYYTDPDTGEWTLIHSITISMHETAYVGFTALTLMQGVATCYFTEVKLEPLPGPSSVDRWELY